MTNQDQSCLRFSLEESIWFQKGKEVNQLHSLSIEPNVTITERNQYVVIEGTLLVTGEYEGTTDTDESEGESQFDPVQQRYIQHVFRQEEEGTYLFHHTFPVDISIPTSRVEDRGAIEVEIASFDYRMPERSCIKLMAELIITGIYDGEQTSYAIGDEEQESYYEYGESTLRQDESTYINHNESVLYTDSASNSEFTEHYSEMESTYNPVESYIPNESYAIPYERNQEMESAYMSNDESYTLPSEYSQELEMKSDEQLEDQDDFYDQLYSDSKENADRTIVPSQGEWNSNLSSLEAQNLNDNDDVFEASAFAAPKEESVLNTETEQRQQSFQSFQFQSSFQIPMPMFSPDEAVKVEGLSKDSVDDESIQTLNIGLEDTEEIAVRYEADSDADEVESEEEVVHQERIQTNFKQRPIYKEEPEQVKQKAETGKLSVSLTDFFAKKDTHTQTRLKVCIVQSGESLSDLASRYDVSKQDIIHYNHLEDESEVEGGKVLYIPQNAVHK